MTLLTQEKLFTNEAKVEAIKDLTLADITEFAPKLLSKLYVEGLVHGNMDVNVSGFNIRKRADLGRLLLTGCSILHSKSLNDIQIWEHMSPQKARR
jgi:hypothetical protein